MRNRRRGRRGGAVIEFALLAPILVSMLIGTMWYGTALIRELQVQQAARDLASMFCRSTDFSGGSTTSGYQTLSDVTAQLGTLSPTGNLVAIFSKLTYVGNSVCALVGTAPPDGVAGNNTPTNTGTHTAACKNYGYFVFTQRYTQGNTGLRSSDFGDPIAADANPADYYKIEDQSQPPGDATYYVTHTGDRSTFNLLPAPQEDGTDGYQSGGPIYLVEVFCQGAGQAGFSSGAHYAYAIF